VQKVEEVDEQRQSEADRDALSGQNDRKLTTKILKIEMKADAAQQFGAERVQTDPGDDELMHLNGKSSEQNAERGEQRSEQSKQSSAFLLANQNPKQWRNDQSDTLQQLPEMF
jgi:hypothetical protein